MYVCAVSLHWSCSKSTIRTYIGKRYHSLPLIHPWDHPVYQCSDGGDTYSNPSGDHHWKPMSWSNNCYTSVAHRVGCSYHCYVYQIHGVLSASLGSWSKLTSLLNSLSATLLVSQQYALQLCTQGLIYMQSEVCLLVLWATTRGAVQI